MSDSNHSPRIERKQKPPRYYVAHRNYLKFLLVDFKERCAYSGQHLQRAGGIGGMDIDHHNPQLKPPARNSYENLFLATRHCNGKKGANWPTNPQKEAGIRFLNPCLEKDYGLHLFEDPVTFEIWGDTPAGRYHVRILDLNAGHLVRERRRRHELRMLRTKAMLVTVKSTDSAAMRGLESFNEEVELMIPPLPQRAKPAPPKE